MAHRKTVVALSVLRDPVSIVPLFMFVGKNFLPAGRSVAVQRSDPHARRHLARRHHQPGRAHRAGHPRDCPASQHTLMTAGGGADKIRQQRLHLRQAHRHRSARRHPAAADAAHPRPAEEVSAGDPHRRRTGQHAWAAIRATPKFSTSSRVRTSHKLAEYSDALLAKMRTIPAWPITDTTLRTGKPEVRLEIDRARAADLGVSVMDIEQALNTLVAGQVASTFNAGDDQYDVRRARPGAVPRQRRRPRQNDRAVDQSAAPSASMRWCASCPAPDPRPSIASTASAR